ncbi:TPA: GlxA family transcriptional regulator [Serratia fonticola]
MINARIGFVLCENMLSSGLSLPIEMWKSAATRYLAEQKKGQGQQGEYAFKLSKPDELLTIRTLGINRNPIPTHSGFSLIADSTLEDNGDYDIIYLPALWRNPRPVVRKHSRLTEWLAVQAAKGTRIAAVGTGCCFLAEAHLLDEKPATTHWHYFEQFTHDYPNVNLKEKYFITQSDTIFCAASIKALSELTVHFIETIYGKQVANHTQRTFFHEIRSNFERQCYRDEDKPHPDEDIVQIQTWIKENCTTDLPMQKLADMAGMSLRNFNRRFKLATDISPLQYILKARIEIAINMLQSTNLSIQEIAIFVGYQDITHFNRQFKRISNVSPSDYRKTVRPKMFHTEQSSLIPRHFLKHQSDHYPQQYSRRNTFK